GYSPVQGWDNDPQAVRVARANARANGVQPRVAVHRRDLTRLPGGGAVRYDVVVANLSDDLLVRAAPTILGRLRPDGVLVLAGVLAGQFARVQRVYAAAGWRRVRTGSGGGWRSGAFRQGGEISALKF
ncbi:MAG: 50S ribosomal protein L11 methyltransferase, partial [Verrucomicrobia bacterium]|nr:50S ribosomal protein L11 methyltransferase [Verrucomicrobiota bacterium]